MRSDLGTLSLPDEVVLSIVSAAYDDRIVNLGCWSKSLQLRAHESAS